MKKTVQVVIAMGFLVGSVSTGIAGQGLKNDPGKAHTPDKIQRSAPSGEEPLPGGSGPGSRSNDLTDMEEVKTNDPKLSKKANDNVPENIQRSAPSGEKALPGGSGPGSRTDQLTGMEEVEPMDPKLSGKKGDAAQATKELEKKRQKKSISSKSKSSSKKSHE
ncbi:MAG: hypothetical protein WD425_11825 [Nitrospirales bacterium]